MGMTVIVTRNATGRVRGFLSSCMLEIAPGVYTSPRMNKAVRERLWAILCDWYEPSPERSIIATWRDLTEPSGQTVMFLGDGGRSLVNKDGITLARGDLTAAEETVLVRHRLMNGGG